MVYEEVGSVYCSASLASRSASAFLRASSSAFFLAAAALASASWAAFSAASAAFFSAAARASAAALLSTWACCCSACAMMRARSDSPASAVPSSVAAGAALMSLSGVAEPSGALSSSEIREPTFGRSGIEIDTGGLPVWALAMPPAPTAAMTPTPRTVELRASPPRCLATRCRPRTGRTESAVGFHSSNGPSSPR